MMEKALLRPAMCPCCGYGFDTASEITGGDARPSPGDVSVCISCGEALVYRFDMLLGKASESNIAELAPKALRTLRNAQLLIRAMGPRPRKNILPS